MVDLTLPDVSPAQDGGDAARRLAERVVAWQHRHPLARRIGPGEVAGWGVIALPYGEVGRDGRPTPLFHQPSLLPGLPHRALVDFAARHAVGTRPGPADWPQRDIERADASAEPAPATRYLLTAAITEPRSAVPRRLLVAPAGPAIWGARPPARARLALAGLLGLLVLAAAFGRRGRCRRGRPGDAAGGVGNAGRPGDARPCGRVRGRHRGERICCGFVASGGPPGQRCRDGGGTLFDGSVRGGCTQRRFAVGQRVGRWPAGFGPGARAASPPAAHARGARRAGRRGGVQPVGRLGA
ncbi:MAG: hypothetical protein ACOZJX_18030 [Pseudomonadota bacterium]